MAALEFKFSSDQQHQLEAIEATCDLFRGQQFASSVFSADSGRKGQTAIGELMVGHGNELRVAPGQLLDNLHSVQEDGCLPATDVLTDGRLRDFTVEMETGTGKTYVYIRSIYELNRRYGITKFVIVVPSVAIREGVLKSFQTTRRHFETLYDRTPLDYFVYDSKDMGPVGNFATSSSIQVMVINIDAFNKGLEKDGTAKEGNLFHRPSEKLTGGFSPRELVSACKPVVIIDEPQSVDNTKQAKAAIKSLNPLFVLRYSATHKQAYNMIYRLTPVDAFERHLVKGICVDSIKAEANLNGAYVRLESVKSDPFSAKVSIDVRQADGTQKRKPVTVKTGADLYQKSGENSDYESGWVVNNIGAAEGDEFIDFQNGEVLELGEALGDVNEEVVKRAQIRRTIEDHLARQFELWPRGVKVLSLFFIDRVDRYRVYGPEVHGGLYAQMFEEEYAGTLNSKAPRRVAKAAGIGRGTWLECYEAVGAPLVRDPHAVHQGYFAKDKKGKFKDSKGAAGTADDAGAFELIMQKKETLISFPDGKDADKDVSFVFSHSALKEGWDNPNVFQICTLVETKDNLTKRQKIDPATFLAQVGDKINRVKNDLIAQGIKYVRLPEDEWYTMRDLELDDYTAYLGQNAWKPDMAGKSLYNYVVYDSAGVERSFAEALDKQEEVLVFAKLPSAFKIDTPLGSYNPDWAYVEEADGERRVYFVTETKGGKNGEPALRDAEKIKIGCAKKHFEALDLGNDFHYNVRTTYQYEAVKA